MPIEVGGHYEIKVLASVNGEDCNNTFNYFCGAGSTTLANAITDFRTLFRAEILPLLSDRYVVGKYEIRQWEGVVWKSDQVPPERPPVWPRVNPLVRYNDRASLLGDPVDDIGDVTTAEMPSLVAVGIAKVCGVVTDMALVALPYEKLMDGGNRFSGIPEAATDDAAGNSLNAAAVTAWNDALIELRSWTLSTGTSGNMAMEVWSKFKDGDARAVAMAPAMARASVTSIILDTQLTSQVTRKPRRGQ